ncbi:MAG: 2-succinyl-6-hydroxy-2,4-cyclohexadiene-1-carboxylate synthase [Myxococcota bacterium]
MTERVTHVSAAGVSLAVHAWGRGPSVLALHGFTGTGGGFAPLAARWSQRYRVVAPDLVGHGASEAPSVAAPYAMEACVEQLSALIDAKALGRVHLFGYSMGGRTALALAARAPEKVASLALLGASPGLAGEDERAARRASDEALAARIEADGVAAFVESWESLPLFASQTTRLDGDTRAALRRDRLSQRASGLAGSLRGMGTGAQPALHAALGTLSVPCWIAAGAEDTKFVAIADQMAGQIPDAQRVDVPAAGHAAHWENANFLAASLSEFWSRVEARSEASHDG